MRNIVSTAVLAILLLLGTSAKAEGPQIQLVPDQNALSTILSVLDTAQTSIDLLQFSFAIDDPESGEINTTLDSYQVAQKLVELKQAKGESLRIRLYLEGQRSTSRRNRKTAEYLEANGIEVHWGGTHAKAIIVDGKTVFCGSTNLTHQSLHSNNETNVVIWDHLEFVRYFVDYFNLLWEAHPRSPGMYSADGYKDGIRLYTDGAYKALLLDLIQTASVTVDFSIYYFNEPDIETALMIAAHERGVKIRGYMNYGDGIDAQLTARNLATAARLRSAGIAEIYFDQDSFFSHSKYLIADGKTIALGTGNWNSSDIKEHPQLYVEIRNADLAKKLTAHLSGQIAYESSRVPAPQLLHRFWLGWRHATLSQPDFDAAIDSRFVDATVETGKNRGLHAYQPVLPVSGGQVFRGWQGNFTLPDEVALVTYQDAETYRAIRDTPPGTAYAQLHRDYFLMQSGHALNSHSVVPAPYTGTVAIGKAYDLSVEDVDWQKGTGYFALTLRKAKASDDSYIQGLQTYLRGISDHKVELGMRGYVVLIHPHYIIEYFNLAESAEHERSVTSTKIENERDNSQVLRLVPLHEQKIVFQPQGQTRIVRDKALGAISVLFDRELDKQRISQDSLAEFKQSFNCQAE